MQSDDNAAELAGNLLAMMTNIFFLGLGAKVMSFYRAQHAAWTDPLSALVDRGSLL